MNTPILEIDNIKVRYSGLPVLQGISIRVNPGETVSVLGANGAGKSTLLRAIMGTQPVFEGRIAFKSREIQTLRTEEIVRLGIVCVPEEKMLFSPLSVKENLYLGAYVLDDRDRIQRNLEFVYNLFPKLYERRSQPASTLSGGEQQMVAIGRGLMSQPQVLMLDEPSLGLAPILVDEVLDTASPSCWWSKMCVKPWIWRIAGMCCKPGGSSVKAAGGSCLKAISSEKPFWEFDQIPDNLSPC
jgi:branched-chain amino acid transport system ATP-binding protein